MNVNIQKFSEGLHEITEEVSPKDLSLPDEIGYPEKLKIFLIIDKFEESFRFKIRVVTEIIHGCDRCLEEFRSPFDETIEQLYQIGSGKFDDDDDVEKLPVTTKEIEIDKQIYEGFLVNSQIKKVCSENCLGLCPVCGNNLNKKKCDCDKDNIDPRLEKLKSLLS